MKVLEHYFPVNQFAPISINYNYDFTYNFRFDRLQDWAVNNYGNACLLSIKCAIFRVVRKV